MKSRQLAAIELTAALLVPAATFGMIRVFAEFGDVLQLSAFALISSLVAIATRRLNLPLAAGTLISLMLLLLATTFVYFRDFATASIIPNGTVFSQWVELATELRTQFRSQVSPVPSVTSFLFYGSVVTWVLAFLTDWGAVRLRLAFEPVLPSAMLFVFGSVPPISSGAFAVRATFVYGLVVSVWAIVQRSVRISSSSVIVSGTSKRIGLIPLLAGGLVMATSSVSVGVAYGDRLPFANSEPVIEFSNSESRGREVSNPFIDLEQRLVEQSDLPLFQVTSDARSYWRIVGLDTYRNTNSAGGQAAVWEVRIGGGADKETIYDQPENTPGQVITQNIEIGSLEVRTNAGTQTENVWIPAALAPQEVIDDGGVDLNTDPLTQTITIGSDFSSRGLEYSVLSAAPTFSTEQLRNAGAALTPGAPNTDIYLQVPNGVSPTVRQTASEVTRGLTNRYDQAIALQNFFQGFDYSLELPARPENLTAEEHFLQTRVGFCQQFSGTFALMARELGIPARVAVGFTWGDELETTPEGVRYGIKGRHAHAWPEVWFGPELGWVPFEPTPGRGIPGSTQYTGVDPSQDASPGTETPEPEIEPTEPAEPSEPEPSEPVPPEPTDGSEQPAAAEEQDKLIANASYGQRRGFMETYLPLLAGISLSARTILILLALSIYPLGMPAFVSLRRRLSVNALRGADPRRQAIDSWDIALKDLRLRTSATPRPSETATEFARRAHTNLGVAGLEQLAVNNTRAIYSPTSVSAGLGEESTVKLGEVIESLAARDSMFTKWKQSLSIQRVFGGKEFASRRASNVNVQPS